MLKNLDEVVLKHSNIIGRAENTWIQFWFTPQTFKLLRYLDKLSHSDVYSYQVPTWKL